MSASLVQLSEEERIMMNPNQGAHAVALSYMRSEIEWSQAYENHLKAVWRAGEPRRSEAFDLQCMYDHNWKQQLEDDLAKRFRPETLQKLKQVADYSLNILAWVIRRMSGIYKKPCIRHVEGNEEHERVEEWLAESSHQLAMLELHRLTMLHRDCLIGPYVQQLPDGTQRIQYRILTPDCCEVIVEDDDPTLMRALLYVYYVADDKGIQRPRYVYYDNERYREYDEFWAPVVVEGNEEGINPFGRIPFVAAHAVFDTQKFWHHEQSRGLRRVNLSVASGLTDFWHSIKVNSFKQLGLSGADFDDLDPGQVLDGAWPLDLGEDGQATVLDMTVDQMRHIEAIWQVAAMVVHTYGLNPKTFRGTMDANSGYQLSVQNQDLMEIHAEQRILFERVEQELYQVVRAVNNVQPNLAELPDGQLFLEFDEVGPGKSPEEKLNYWRGAVEAKLSSHVRALMALHDLTEEEAEAEWERIQEESRASMPVSLVPPMDLGEPEVDEEEDEPAPELPAQMQPGEQGEEEAEA